MAVTFGDKYKGNRGSKVIEVVEVDRKNQQVVFKRDNYEHLCMLPFREFKTQFTEKLPK